MRIIRSLLFALFFYPATVIAVLIAIPAALVSRRALVAITRGWSRYFSWCAAMFLAIRSRVEGTLPKSPVLVAAKHQSMFETLELVVLLGAPAAIVKQELGKIPLWGWVARRYGVIPVDRAGGATALRQMVREAQAAVAQGRMIVIFPEGTRVAPGEQPALQPGFAGLYRALGLPVVPVAVDTGRFWPRRSFATRPGLATLRFGEPIPPGLPRAEIEARVHAAINALE
jgi:1-acyl-sn-glycerol-3-phosphate acyltransferase